MVELLKEALNKIDIVVIIINSKHKITFWNKYNEKISNIPSKNALNNNIAKIVPIFNKTLYQNILLTVLMIDCQVKCNTYVK